ncbi:MAG: sigma-54-dependent Fis family transcriptional regulator, partial [Pyrinomonadaceae bacterium]|nr:sigma-54-dependent Fis family transcriptional regulator [Pyrinomonadaceae bacterium]
VRVIAATNKILTDEIRDGRFRSDLFYRLNVISFNLPPLRERAEDIPKLIEYFLETLGSRYNRRKLELSDTAMDQLQTHTWPGNIRELKNTLERNIALSTGDQIEEIHGIESESFIVAGSTHAIDVKQISLADVEKKHILDVLSSVDGKREKAASILGITSRTLYRKLKEYNETA